MMNSTYVPVYTPHTTSPLAASRGWGIGSALGWIPYNVEALDEIHPTEILTNGALTDNSDGWTKSSVQFSSNGEYTTLSKVATSSRANISQFVIGKIKRNTEYEITAEVFVEKFVGTPDGLTNFFLRTLTPVQDNPSAVVDTSKIGQWQTVKATGRTRDIALTEERFLFSLGTQEMAVRVRNVSIKEVGAKPTYTQSQEIAENAIQVTLGFDIRGEMEMQFPEFFQDCYIEDDRVAKVRERTQELKFSITTNQNVETYLESDNVDFTRKSSGSQGTFEWTVSSERNLEDYFYDNGWVYLSVVVPAATSLADLAVSVTLTPKFLFDPVYDTRPRTFRYNGLKQPYYLFVRDVNRSVLPAVNNLLTSYDRGKRNFNYGQTYQGRQISLNCFIKANSMDEVPYLIEDLANFLDIGETTIRFADAKDRSWKVVLDGASEINQSLNVGDFTLTFTCIEMTSYGDEVSGVKTLDTMENDFLQIHNDGTAETHPVMKITFDEDSPQVNIVGTGQSENITLGYDSTDGSGSDDGDFNPMPWQFSEFFDNMNAMKQMDNNTTPPWLFDREFVRNTTLETTKGTLKLKNNKFPKVDKKDMGVKFYGGGVTRVNPKAVNDFALEVAFSAQGNPQYWTDHHQFIILYDDQMIPFANVAFGYVAKEKKIRFHLATQGSSNDPEVRIGLGKMGKEWHNFIGKIIIERKNNRWRIQAGQFKSQKASPMQGSDLQYGSSMMRNVKSSAWRQLPQETWSRKFGAVGLLFANIDNRPQIARWQIHHMKLWEHLQKPANSPAMTLSFKKGDELVVDFTKAQVWLNGTLAPAYVQPSTDWFSLKPGKNTIGVSGLKGTLEYEYVNRYK